MRLRWWFRSPYVLHFSASRVTRERARGARRHPPGYPAPACGQRFGDFQPDSRSLTLLSRLNVARVLIPPCHVHGLCNAMFC